MNEPADAGGFDPAPGGWRIVLALALVGAALGFAWGIADRPRWSATATVAVESDSQGSDRARLERFAQRGESEEVARRAAALLGKDVPGADLLADVSVRPAGRGGFLVVTATADAPDIAAAAADGFQRALVDVEGDPLALGRAAAIPGAPSGDRSAPLWALIGLVAGALVGVLVVALVRVRQRRGGVAAAARSVDASPALLAGHLGVDLFTFGRGLSGSIVAADGAVLAVAPEAAPGVAALAGTLGMLDGAASRSIALTAVGAGADALGLAAAVAVVGAEAGLRVLLVDADLARPDLAGRFGVEPAPGLREYIAGQAAPREVLRSVAVANGGEFAAVPAGLGGPGAPLDVPRFATLVERLARIYDVVLYAAPPILDSGDADAVIALVDEVVPLVGPDATATDLEHAAALLGGSRVAIVASPSG